MTEKFEIYGKEKGFCFCESRGRCKKSFWRIQDWQVRFQQTLLLEKLQRAAILSPGCDYNLIPIIFVGLKFIKHTTNECTRHSIFNLFSVHKVELINQSYYRKRVHVKSKYVVDEQILQFDVFSTKRFGLFSRKN